MMCCPSHVTATAYTELVCPLKVDERPADVVQPDLLVGVAAAKADHKVHAVSSAAAQSTMPPTSKMRSRVPSSVHSPCGFVVPAGNEAARPAAPPTPCALNAPRWCAARAVAPNQIGAVIRAGDYTAVGTAATHQS